MHNDPLHLPFQFVRGDDEKYRLYFQDNDSGITDWQPPEALQAELSAVESEVRDIYAELFGDLLAHFQFLILAIVLVRGVEPGGGKRSTERSRGDQALHTSYGAQARPAQHQTHLRQVPPVFLFYIVKINRSSATSKSCAPRRAS